MSAKVISYILKKSIHCIEIKICIGLYLVSMCNLPWNSERVCRHREFEPVQNYCGSLNFVNFDL